MAARYKGAVAALAVVLGLLFVQVPKAKPIPPHMQGHPIAFFPDLISLQDAAALRALTRKMESFPTNANDLNFYQTRHEHIGEAIPFDAKAGCPTRFLVPSINRTHCVLPGRIDIGRHFILTGGAAALRERFEVLASRVLTFGRYQFSFGEYPEVVKLFESPKFQQAATAVCPTGKQYLDPFQFNFIVQLPGQTVPAHIDGAYFWGATRFQFPQWLLAAMVFSGFWQDRFVDQVQVVAYYHNSTVPEGERGDFLYYQSAAGAPKSVAPLQGAGSVIDGSKTVHAADVYLSSVQPPLLHKEKQHNLRYKDGGWQLEADGKPTRSYKEEQLRMSIVYRARCFRDAAEAARFAGQGGEEAQMLRLEEILERFCEDFLEKGTVSSVESCMSMDRMALGLKIVDAHIAYPMPQGKLISYNYCALATIYPALSPLLLPFCS